MIYFKKNPDIVQHSDLIQRQTFMTPTQKDIFMFIDYFHMDDPVKEQFMLVRISERKSNTVPSIYDVVTFKDRNGVVAWLNRFNAVKIDLTLSTSFE